MINGGEWHWACSDYDTHEADSVPRFGGRRARGDLQRGPPRQNGRGTGPTRGPQRGRLEQSFDICPLPFPSALSLSFRRSTRRSTPPSIVYKLSEHLAKTYKNNLKHISLSDSPSYLEISSTRSLNCPHAPLSLSEIPETDNHLTC
jgi:hypothetical protein